METILNFLQIILAILLVVAILLQSRGAGLGAVFGGGGGGGNIYRSKRGAEKRLFQATIVIAILFFGVALANVVA